MTGLLFFFFFFYLYIYPPDSQESNGGAIHRVNNYPDLLPEMPRYALLPEMLRGISKILTQLLIEIEKLLKVTFKKVFCFGPKTITAVFSLFNFEKLADIHSLIS